MYSSRADGRLSHWNSHLWPAENPCHLRQSVSPTNLNWMMFIIHSFYWCLHSPISNCIYIQCLWWMEFCGQLCHVYHVWRIIRLFLGAVPHQGQGYRLCNCLHCLSHLYCHGMCLANFRIQWWRYTICSHLSLRYMPTSTHQHLCWSPERYSFSPDLSHCFYPLNPKVVLVWKFGV